MWLEEFHRHYSDAAFHYTGHRLDPQQVEDEFLEAKKYSRIKKSILEALENSGDWTFEKWWQPLSTCLDENDVIPVPPNLNTLEERRKIVGTLHNRFKSIEGVSVVLRFLDPEEFGILSFPVVHLINLAPEKKPVDYYLEYLRILRDLRNYYGVKSKSLRRIADIDMALWSAARFSQDADLPSKYASLRNSIEAMYKDEYFQEVRFKNMLKGLRLNWKQTDLQHLVFARALLEYDPRLAVAAAAKPFDTLVRKLAKRYDVEEVDDKGEPRSNKQLIQDFKDKELREFVVDRDVLNRWRLCRNRAVHEANPPLQQDAEEFVKGVASVLKNIGRQKTGGSDSSSGGY